MQLVACHFKGPGAVQMSKSPWCSRDHCGLNQAAHKISYEKHQDDHMMIIYDHVYIQYICNIWLYMIIYDYIWLYMIMYDYVWLCMIMTPLATVLFVARCAQSTSCYRWKAVAPELFTAHKCSKICWKQKIKCQMPCPHPTGWWWGGGGPLATWEWKTAHWNFKADTSTLYK